MNVLETRFSNRYREESMSFLSLRAAMLPAIALLSLGVVATSASAQCAQQTVAYSPVVQTAYSPVVLQTTPPDSGWYPGKRIGEWLFGRRETTVAVAAPVTATTAYRPTYPMSYSAGYAPTSYTAGYASYAPQQSYAVGYAPAVQTSYRPVTLSPATTCCESACDPCAGAASYGAATAGYDVSGTAGCSSCAGGSSAVYYDDSTTSPSQGYSEPTPAIEPGADVPTQRSLRPEPAQDESARRDAAEPQSSTPQAPNTFRSEPSDSLQFDDDSSNAYFEAPELFNPQDRTTQRPTAPVWTAVYRDTTGARPAASASTRRTADRHEQQGASGWRSATD